MYHITFPVADWHSWRQADTAAVARNFVKFGFDPLRPRFDDLSNIASGKDNLQGWRMAEFPLYQYIGSLLYKSFPNVPIEVWLRLVTIISSVLTAFFLGLLVAEVADFRTGIITSFIFAVLPYNVYYGRTILPDPFMVFWAILSIYLLLKAFEHERIRWIYLLMSGISAALSLLAKPMGAFLLLPEIYIFLRNFKVTKSWIIASVLFMVISVVPLFWWRQWIARFPEGIPVYIWLFNEGNIRFKGAWFYWLFYERIAQLILGGWGLLLFGIGLVAASAKKEVWFFRWWLMGAILYLIIIARGNVQHDYYQILILPVISIYTARGIIFLLSNKTISRTSGIFVASVSLLFGLAFSWYTVRTYYWVNHPEIVEAGKAADRILPKTAKVIAPYGGDTTFLYQINRQGWPVGFSIDEKIKMGAQYYVTTSPSGSDPEVRGLMDTYRVIEKNNTYAIIDLTKNNTANNLSNQTK